MSNPDSKAKSEEQRYLRQKDIFNPDELKELEVSIVGVGAIGRQVALQLASIGVGNIHIIDFDTVEVVNLAPQCFFEKDLGLLKVDAVKAACKLLNEDVKVQAVNAKWTKEKSILLNPYVFCCVDSMEVRKDLWDTCGNTRASFIDTRMASESVRVLTMYNTESKKYYPTTLYHDNEAMEEACTSKTTTFCSNIAAGLAISALSQVLRSVEFITYDYVFNLKTLELVRLKEAG